MKRIILLFAVTAIFSTLGLAQTKTSVAPAKKSVAPAKTNATPTKTTVAPAKTTVAPAPLLKNQIDSVSYSFGASIATDLKNRGVNNLNNSIIIKAMNDVFASQEVILSPEKCQETIYAFLGGLEKKKFEGNISAGAIFLAENKKKPAITELPSGLQFEVITPAEGPKPSESDDVTVHYRGTLTNGAQFDSSIDRGQPASFTLNQVIPGWTEGLQQMSVGSKYRFFIPYNLGYGERGAGKDIPPYSTLIFEVELLKIGK
jgi:FKBP-type peptidyl-prolyl cis-trans isomerase